MEIKNMMEIMDLSFLTRRTIEHSLHEIDRRALNAMVLVKRHGKKLAGYGVVAQAFENRQPTSRKQLRLCSAQSLLWFARKCASFNIAVMPNCFAALSKLSALATPAHSNFGKGSLWQEIIATEEAEALNILRALIRTVTQLQEGILEQEYVVTIGRIEAALSEASGAPLMRVFQEMGVAVATVRDAIWRYRNHLEEVLHESSIGI